MSLLKDLAIETSAFVNNKINSIINLLEDDVKTLEQKIKDSEDKTIKLVDEKVEEAKKTFVLKKDLIKKLSEVNDKIDDNYKKLDDKKIDKTEAIKLIEKVRTELISITDDLDARKMDSTQVLKLLDDLNNSLTNTINALGKLLQDQINNLKLTKADKDKVNAEFKVIRESITKENTRALQAEEAISNKLDNETSRAKASEQNNTKAIKLETDRAIKAETNNADNLSKESERAKAKEDDLQKQIDDNNSQVNADLNKEVKRAKTKEDDLQKQIDDNNKKVQFDIKQEEQTRIKEDNSIKLDVQKQTERIDSILALSTADKDSFKEIVDYIEKVDLENDTTFAGYVVSNNKALGNTNDALQHEITRAKTAENVIQHQLNIETSRASKREKEIYIELQDEISRAKKSEDSTNSNLKDEVDRAIKEEKYLQDQIDDIHKHSCYIGNNNASGNLNIDNDNSSSKCIDSDSVQAIVQKEETRAKKSEDNLQKQITKEETRATLKETDLSDNLNNEISRAKTKEEYLETTISQENVRAMKEENYLNSKIVAEISRAKKEEGKLQDEIDDCNKNHISLNLQLSEKLDTEIDFSHSNVKSLTEKINNEIARATSKENNLNKLLNDELDKYKEDNKSIADIFNDKFSNFLENLDNIKSELGIEKSRVDAILTASSSDKKTFSDVMGFINKIDLKNDTNLPKVFLDFNSKIKDLDNKINLEVAKNIKTSDAAKKDISLKIDEIKKLYNDLQDEVNKLKDDSKNKETALEDTLDIHDKNIKLIQNDLKNTKIQNEQNQKKLLKDNQVVLDSFEKTLEENNLKTSKNIDGTVKKLNEISSLLKTNQTDLNTKFSDLKTSVEKNQTDIDKKVNSIDTNTKNNIEVIFKKLKDTKVNTENQIKDISDNISTLKNINFEDKIKNSDSVKQINTFIQTLDDAVKKTHTKISSIDNWISNKDKEPEKPKTSESSIFSGITPATEDDIKKLEEEINSISDTLTDYRNIVESIKKEVAKNSIKYDDTNIKKEIANNTNLINANTDDIKKIDTEISDIKKGISEIMSGSSIDLNSFGEIINYINSIDLNNKDIVNLITVNNDNLKKINTDLDNTKSKLKDLETIPDSIDTINEKINKINTNISTLSVSGSDNSANASEISKVFAYIDTETKRASDAEVELQKNISNEKNRAQNEEAVLQKNITDEKDRAKIAEDALQKHIDVEKNRAVKAESNLQNDLKNIVSGKTIVNQANDAKTLNGKKSEEFLLVDDYNGLADNGNALTISDGTISLMDSKGFIHSAQLPKVEAKPIEKVPSSRDSVNSLRTSQYMTLKSSAKNTWQIAKNIILDPGVYNFNLGSENSITSYGFGRSSNYDDIDQFVGQALILPMGDFDNYGSLTKDNYNENTYLSKDTNMFNLMDCTQDDFNNFSGQIYLKERQEVRILLRSVIDSKITFLLKTQIYKTY